MSKPEDGIRLTRDSDNYCVTVHHLSLIQFGLIKEGLQQLAAYHRAIGMEDTLGVADLTRALDQPVRETTTVRAR